MMNRIKLSSKRSQRNRFQLKRKSKASFRLSVFRSNRHIYAQIIDEQQQKTIYFASSLNKTFELKKGSDKNAAFKVGEIIAEKAIKNGFREKITFDRGSYLYHGRVKELAEGARSKGLNL